MTIIDKCKIIFRYHNAVKRKYKNKQVVIADMQDGSYQIEVVNLDKHYANDPCVSHRTEKGIVRLSAMRCSRETLEAIVLNGIEILHKEQVKTEIENI